VISVARAAVRLGQQGDPVKVLAYLICRHAHNPEAAPRTQRTRP
jgi:aspartate 1-decarboxylase